MNTVLKPLTSGLPYAQNVESDDAALTLRRARLLLPVQPSRHIFPRRRATRSS